MFDERKEAEMRLYSERLAKELASKKKHEEESTADTDPIPDGVHESTPETEDSRSEKPQPSP
ncbi:hypothetical protein [Streptomyces sp. NPDC057002]|uniref:hypothetical protein n=1 Tax=Streptomyces sp. NPDC057002 TaxID=3345992 RepID=UPI00363E2047